MKFVDTIKAFGSKVAWNCKKNSPEICLVAGITTAIASVVFACRATVKAIPVLEDARTQLEAVAKCTEDGTTANGEEYTAQDAKKDKLTIKVQTGLKVMALFAPAAIFLGGSIAAQICGYKILSKRLAMASAAYAALASKFGNYRNYIREKYGEDADREAFHGIKAVERTEDTGEVDADGNPIKKTYMVQVANDDDYSALFDECSSRWEPDFEINLSWLRQQQAHWTTILRLRKGDPVFLNEVRSALDLPKTQLGQVVGWRYDQSKDHGGDNLIDFGIEKIYQAYRNGEEFPFDRSFLLDFNVDGNILYSV